MDKDSYLKQCPFCGGDPEYQYRGVVFNDKPKYVTIKCSMCGAGTKLFLCENVKKAETAWNRRIQ